MDNGQRVYADRRAQYETVQHFKNKEQIAKQRVGSTEEYSV